MVKVIKIERGTDMLRVKNNKLLLLLLLLIILLLQWLLILHVF